MALCGNSKHYLLLSLFKENERVGRRRVSGLINKIGSEFLTLLICSFFLIEDGIKRS